MEYKRILHKICEPGFSPHSLAIAANVAIQAGMDRRANNVAVGPLATSFFGCPFVIDHELPDNVVEVIDDNQVRHRIML